MTLPEIAIRRPVLATVMSLVIVLFGVVGLTSLGVREFPAVDPPVVTIFTNYPGASAAIVDSQITEPIEAAVNGIAGVRVISSTSREGRSEVRVEFNIGADMEGSANDVRDKVGQVVRRLPANAEAPVVEKADADSDPVVFMTLESETRNVNDISYFADRVVKERVQTIPGVSSVRIFGEKRYAMRVWMDAEAMAAHGVTTIDVENAVGQQNVELPSGRIEGENTELSVNVEGRLNSPQAFERIIVRTASGRQIRLGDVADVELGAQNPYGGVKSELVPMVGIAVIPQPNTNAIAIADEFYRRYKAIQAELPPEFRLEIGFDFTTYVRQSVEEVKETLFISFALVALIIFMFLRDGRATLIPVVAIPVSIISGFFIMYVAGFSINILTLVAVVLSIGLVCDDAIVVLENIYGKIEAGMPPFQAAVEGTREVYFAVLATTITLAAVFTPIIFLEGLVGRLFREFGVVVAGTVLVSSFVALTLSPSMCARLLKRHERPGLIYRTTEPLFEGLIAAYRWTLRAFMRIRWVAWPIIAAVGYASFWLYESLPRELAPLEDRGNIRIGILAPEGSTAEYTSRQLDELALFARANVPEIRRSFSVLAPFDGAPNTGFQNLYLVDASQRTRSQEEIYRNLIGKLDNFTGLRTFLRQPPTIGSRFGGLPVQFVLRAPTLDALGEVLPSFLDKAARLPSLRFVDADFKFNRPELRLSMDRARAAELGVDPMEVARTIRLAYGAARLGFFPLEGRQYEVIGQMRRGDRDEPTDFHRLKLRGRAGVMVGLDAVVDSREETGPAAVYRFDRYVSATISAAPAPGFTLGQAIDDLQKLAADALPSHISTALAGQSRDLADSSGSLIFAFLFALLLVFLTLSAQFESFRDPVTIFVTVPTAAAGALASLWVTGQSLNVFSQIGVIMLIGLVTKNGILVVEFANQRRDGGLSVAEAAVEGAVSRFRPVLMTSLSTILGILPIALQLGGSAGSRQSLGIAVVGGLIFSGFLTLYLVPAVYSFLGRESPDLPLDGPPPPLDARDDRDDDDADLTHAVPQPLHPALGLPDAIRSAPAPIPPGSTDNG